MLTDAELLGSFADDRLESAFKELVDRHMGLVYSAALRETRGDSALAEDITQAVFTDLAQKAATLRHHPALAGWLYTSVRWMTANARRANERRQRREKDAHAMNELCSSDSPESTWRQVSPLLDDAMHEMSEKDRAAVVLRFFEDRTHKDVGLALGLSENAARLRVDRALEKLRHLLLKRGVTSPASGLAAALAVGVTAAPPTGLAATVSAAAVAATASAAAAASSSTLGFLGIMSMTKLQAGLATVLILSAVTLPVWQEFRFKRSQRENVELRAQSSAMAALQQEVERLSRAEADQAELERLRRAHSQLVGELAKHRANAGVARRATEEAAELRAALERQKTNASERAPKVLAAMMEGAKGLEAQDIRNKIARLNETLHLSAEQEETIRVLLVKQAELRNDKAKKLMLGELSAEDRAELAKVSPASVEEAIRAVLNPEQQTAYSEFKGAESEAQARLSASGDVIQLERKLRLTGEQQDQAFVALYNLAIEGSAEAEKAEASSVAASGISKAAALEAEAERERHALERRTAALQGILTAEQLERYREMQTDRINRILEMFKAFEAGANSN